MNEDGSFVEWYWPEKYWSTQRSTCPTATLCPPQITHGKTRNLTQAYEEKGRRRTAFIRADQNEAFDESICGPRLTESFK